MKFPVDEIIQSSHNKYELSVAMIKYGTKLEEIPELLLEFKEKDRDKRLKIIIGEILKGKVKYSYNDK
ncbi:MAG: hypothetical protein KKH98_11610 [Spirochaetes bacterium]|nr:hypothetical protein [Spirochaetota bacterium]